jgi:hypothetical protein
MVRTPIARLTTYRIVREMGHVMPTRSWKRNKELSVVTLRGRWVSCWRASGGVRSWSWTMRRMGGHHLSGDRLT